MCIRDRVFVVNSIVYQYNDLKSEFLQNRINTRYKNIILPRHLLSIGQRSYVYYAIKYFNEIPNELKNLSVNIKVLKKKSKKKLGTLLLNNQKISLL